MNARIAFVTILLSFFSLSASKCQAAALQIVSATAITNGTSVGVTFNGPLDAASAGTAANYSFSGGLTASDAVVRPDGNSVSLTASGPVPAGTTLTVNGVKDASGTAIAANSTVTVAMSGLQAQDIGDVVDTATVVPFANGEFDLLAGGRAIWANQDRFNFIFEQRTGDFDVKVQLARYVSPDDQARAGLMMRESTDPGSINADLVLYRPERQLWGLTLRTNTGDATSQPFAKAAPVTPPNAWVRMRRMGNELRVYLGTNGFDWMDSVKQTADFPATVLVGMATMATEGATTDRVAVDYRNYGDMLYPGASINITAQPQNVSTLAGTTATFTVTAGTANAPQSELNYQWQRNGTNIVGATDASYTTPLLTVADQNAKFRVLLSLPGASATSSEATLQVTQDTTPPTVVAAYALQDGNTIGVLFSEAVDATTATNAGNYQVSGGLAVDSVTRQGDSKSVVLALSGGTVTSSTTVTVTGIKDLSGNLIAANTSPKVTLLPFTSLDIGDAVPSTVTPVGTNDFEVVAGGRDIWGTDDSFNFIYETKTNDFDVIVQVANFVPVSNNARASLMVRESLDTGSRNIDAILYPISRQIWGVTVRSETSFDTTQPVAGGVSTALPDSWLRARRNGNVFNVYYGKGGSNWLSSYTLTTDYPAEVLVGIATASNDNTPEGRIPVSYRNFRDFTYPNASITITQQPASTVSGAGKTVTFTVGAQFTGVPTSEAVYQWQTNGVNIAGANGASYTTPALTVADAATKYRVTVSVPGAQAVSQEASVNVTQDTTPPRVLSALALGGASSVTVTFDEAVDPSSATNSANFVFSGGLTITDAVQSQDQTAVAFTLSGAVPAATTIRINNVKDLSGNVISANTTVNVTVLPLSAADIGTVNVPSTDVPLSAKDFDVVAGGSDIWDVADGFNFIYEPKSGDFDVSVQVTKDAAVQGTARASLMVRETLDPGSKNLDLIVYPATRQLWGVTVRTNTDEVTSQPLAAGAPVSFPNVWLRISRHGSQIVSYYGTNGVDWPLSFPLTVDFVTNVFVGMATVSADNSANGRMAVSYRNFGDFVPPADTTPPIVLFAERDPNDPSKVTVIFSEPLQASVAGNYSISGGVTVNSVAPGADSSTVVLSTTPIAAGASATLTLNGVKDVAGNAVLANTQIQIEVPPGNQPPVQQESGPDRLLVVEAEDYDAKLDAGGTRWVLTTSPTGFSGTGAMIALPNAGRNVNIDTSASPRLDYKVNFLVAGTYTVWVRGLGDSAPGASANDSVNLGLDGTLTSGRISTFPDGAGYVWSAATLDATNATMQVSAAGVHTLNVWMREDGFIIDKILLTSNASYVPAGSGPPESGRGETGPELAISRANGQIVLTWSGNATLESADQIAGGWTTVTGAVSPFPVSPTGQAKFYRLRQ